MGPASFILSEEVTIAGRNQMGLQAQEPDWQDLRRGMDREEGECRILLTKQLTVAFGGITDICMTSDTEYRTVKAFIYKEARLADESCYSEWEALWDDDAFYWVASVINWRCRSRTPDFTHLWQPASHCHADPAVAKRTSL